LAGALADPAPGVRATALEAAGAFLPDAGLEAALRDRLAHGEPRERELALAALVAGRVEDATDLARAAASSEARELRARAAEAAGALGDRALLAELAADAEPMVRGAAVDALGALAGEAGGAELLPYLGDPDPTVRAALLDRLSASPVVPAATLLEALERSRLDRMNDARLAGVRALAARGAAAPRERGAVLETLGRLAEDADYLVRREAATALVGLGAPRPAPGAIETGHGSEWYREVLAQARRRPRVVLETERGALVLRLECPEAPITCLSFLKLAAQGYFDGTRFHRVVPDFVVQGGDPRGDGWGGPGYLLRDEINRLRYRRGAVGMALSGPDSGGSQFFIALSAQPHLDGGYTLFGTVVEGDEVLDQLRQGDRIVRAREVE
jgi:cyclophilin family peptidyl-prolyl cis-trans isomerase/HEAT repeat protein